MMRFAAFSAACLMLAAPACASTAEPFTMSRPQPHKAWLRGVEPGTTGSIESPTVSGRPPCPPDRKVGTGAGFCMIN